jgi:tetratricopeptide (TPR) repeat protein
MMTSQAKKWIVKDDVGHIYGPFDLNKLRDLLTKGILTGEEEAAQYPAGDWQPMSAEADLYNLILDALSAEKKKAPPISPKPNLVAVPRQDEEAIKTEIYTKTPSKTQTQTQTKSSTKSKKKKIPEGPRHSPLIGSSKETVIELTDTAKLIERFRLKSNVIPIILIILAFILFFLGSTLKTSARKNVTISLLAPHIKSKGSSSRSQEFVKEGMGFFYKDTISNYIRAEEDFVQAIEQAPDNSSAILMLILTDLELWPLTKQDSSDQSILQNLLQLISKIDVLDTKREIAAAAVEMALGHDAVARTQIDSALVKNPGEGFLYALKGQTYHDSAEYSQAASYFEKAMALLPAWAKPPYYLGLSYSKQGLGAQAQQSLIQALKINPSHPGARLELGVIESRDFNHDDKAREFLTVALDGDERLPPFTESRGRISLAGIFMRAGDNSAAKKQALIAAQLTPSDADVTDLLLKLGEKKSAADPSGAGQSREHMALGDQYMRTANYLGAQAQYKSAFEANPQNARAAMKVAEALWKLHQSNEAMDYLQKSVGADPRFIEGYVLLADYKSQRYDFEGAARALDAAIKRNPKNYEIFRGYAELEFRRGNISAAEVSIIKAIQLYEIDLSSNILMSKIQMAKKDLLKALEFAKKATDIDRGDPDAQVNYGHVLAVYQGVKAGVNYLKDLIDLYPAIIELRVGLADILITDEQYSVAEEVLKQVIAAQDTNKEAYLLLGDAEFDQENFDGAIASYLSAARIDPSDPTPLFRSGEVYLKANKPSEAIKQFQLVLRVNPLFPRTHYNLARAYFSHGLTEEAISELEQEKKLNPKLADPYEFSGDILLTTRKFTQAIRDYQKASEFRPLGAGIYVKLAKAYRGAGSYDAAMAMLRLAAAKESGFSEIYKEYGYIYDVKGMPAEAVTFFEKYLSLEPNASDKDAITEKIKQLK